MLEPLDHINKPASWTRRASKIIVLANVIMVLLYLWMGNDLQEFGVMGAALLILMQGGAGFLIGLLLVIFGNRTWGRTLFLCSIATLVFGFLVCFFAAMGAGFR